MTRSNKKNNLSILLVANTTWNIHNFRLNVLKELTEKGYKIYVIAPIDQYISYKDQFPALKHIDLIRLSRKSTNPIDDILLTRELYSLYKKIKPDLILHYTVKPNIFGGIAAGILGIPSFAVVTGLGYAFIHGGLVKEIIKFLYRISSRFHKRFIFENIDDLKLFEKLKMIKIGQGISIKGCGVDTERFKPAVTKKANDPMVFTFIGRLLYDKGIKEFVTAAKNVVSKHPNTKFNILGDFDTGNPAAVPENVFKSWLIEGQIEYLGFKTNIEEYILESDCIVLPSYREAIARALTEAMAMEKPIIASDTAGCIEAVEEGKNGFLVPVADAEALEASFLQFIQLSNEKRLEMGKFGRLKVLREFDDRLIAKQIVQILEDSLKV